MGSTNYSIYGTSSHRLHQLNSTNQHNSQQPQPTHKPPTGTPLFPLPLTSPTILLGGGDILFPIIIPSGKYMHPSQTTPLSTFRSTAVPSW